jgi:hypothetical protein
MRKSDPLLKRREGRGGSGRGGERKKKGERRSGEDLVNAMGLRKKAPRVPTLRAHNLCPGQQEQSWLPPAGGLAMGKTG